VNYFIENSILDTNFKPINYPYQKQVVGFVSKCEDGRFHIQVAGARMAYWSDEEYTDIFKGSKQQCWDYIARNYPQQLFYWNV
jgi:hypothetical protein